MAVLALGVVLAATEAGVAAYDEELCWGKVVDFTLARDFSGGLLRGGIGVEGKGNDVFFFQGGSVGAADRILQEPSLASERVVGAAVLDQRGLCQGVEGFAVRGRGKPFKTLVVAAPGLGICGCDGSVGVVNRRTVCAEGDGTIARGEKGARGLDRGEKFSGAGEAVNVGTVFVTDPV